MLGEAVGGSLGAAVGVAISPVPVIAVILMLFSRRATANGLAFVLGWVLALSLVGTVVLLAGLEGSDGAPASAVAGLKLVIGVLFLFLGWRQWSSRPRRGTQPTLPSWMAAIDGLTPVKAFGLAALLGGVNPKNLGLTLAAATTISAQALSVGGDVVAMGVFVLVASSTVAGPVLYQMVAGAKAKSALTSLRTWLEANNNTVMMVLLVVLGAKLLGDGIAGLT